MSIDGHIRSPLLTDYDRWRRVIFDRPGSMSFQRMNDSFVFFVVTIDEAAGSIALTQPANAWTTPVSLSAIGAGSPDSRRRHEPSSRAHGAPLLDRNSFLLVTRGFHWIQEYPFNR